MKNRQDPMLSFLDDLSGPSATPGGGAAAALTGAMSAALLEMVCNLTIGRPRFAQFEAELKAVSVESNALRAELTGLFEADQRAFEEVMAAYRLAKRTETERQTRRTAIHAALQQASQVQLTVAIACAGVVRLAGQIIDKINPNALGDAFAAVRLAEAGFSVAHLNVAINLGLLNASQSEGMIQKKLDETFTGLKQDKDRLLSYIMSRSGVRFLP